MKLIGWGRVYNKFLVISISVSVIPILLLGLFSFVISTRNIVDSYVSIVHDNLITSNNILNILTADIRDKSRQILANEIITNAIQNHDEADGMFLGVQLTRTLDMEIQRILDDNRLHFSVYLFSDNGFRYQYNSDNAVWDRLGDFKVDKWYQETINARGREMFFLYNVMDMMQKDMSNLSTSKLLIDLETGEEFGILVINVRKEYYNKVFPVMTKPGDYVIAEKFNSETRVLNLNNSECHFNEVVIRHMNGNDVRNNIILRFNNTRTGWSLVHVVSRVEVMRNNLLIPIITLIVSLILIFGSILVSIISARAITEPLSKLNTAIVEMEDKGYTTVGSFGDDDVGIIGNRFIEMAQKNVELNSYILDMQALEREAEFNALQAQINPHFLYNTLTTIYWMSKFGKQDDVAQIALDLSSMFKMVLSNHDNMITVSEEIEYIRQYLSILNKRYNDKIQIKWELEDAIYDKYIMKLILQPLVENAIKHGLEPKTGEWKLTITGKLRSDDLIFSIEDNGIGMDIKDSFAYGVGLENVSERISLKHGSPYGLSFESEKNVGTKVTIRIPRNDSGE